MLPRVRPAAFTKNLRFPFGASNEEIKEQHARERERILKQEIQKKAENFHKLDTVEERIIGVNMPAYYGFKGLALNDRRFPYNCLHTIQKLTHTHILSSSNLPQQYEFLTDGLAMQDLIPTLKHAIENSIVFEHEQHNYRLKNNSFKHNTPEDKCQLDNLYANALIYKINRIFMGFLSKQVSHISEYQVDFEPRREAFWYATGMDAPNYIRKRDPKYVSHNYETGQDYWLPIHYVGSPVLQLRHVNPLDELLSLDNVCTNKDEYEVPAETFSPLSTGFGLERRHAAIVPGFWLGEKSQFGILSYHNCGHLYCRPETANDTDDALMAQAILTSFSWLLAQAYYQGFTLYNELTYPFVTQTIITNGQWWSFAVYQLNTITLQHKFIVPTDRTNLLWMTKPMKLYDDIDGNAVIGFNSDVLVKLLQLYMNAPMEKLGVNLSPYLSNSVKYAAHIEDNERREWIEKCFKHIISNRPRHRLVPEIPKWHRIYYFGAKPTHIKKTDPWLKGINPMARKLDEHDKIYVPKPLRPDPKNKKIGRYANTYYPQV